MIKNKDVRIERSEGYIKVTDGENDFFIGKDCEANRSLAVDVYLAEKFEEVQDE